MNETAPTSPITETSPVALAEAIMDANRFAAMEAALLVDDPVVVARAISAAHQAEATYDRTRALQPDIDKNDRALAQERARLSESYATHFMPGEDGSLTPEQRRDIASFTSDTRRAINDVVLKHETESIFEAYGLVRGQRYIDTQRDIARKLLARNTSQS